jgi:hypothetical protein
VSRTRVTREQAASVEYDHTPFPAGTRILDIGCGDGEELRALAARGCQAIGIDVTMARVLRPGAVWELTVHGAGYDLRSLLRSPLRRRVYAARTMLNTVVYRATGRRWLLGTTIYQSARRLTRDLERQGIRVTRVTPSPTFAGLPYFIYLRAENTAAPPAASPAARR